MCFAAAVSLGSDAYTHFYFDGEYFRFPKYVVLILKSYILLIGVFITRQFINRVTFSDNTCGLYSAVLGLYLGRSGYIYTAYEEGNYLFAGKFINATTGI
jgi:hypothetical protein